MSQQVYINGRYYSREDAKISVYDHGLIYGDGVFEGLRIYGGIVFRLREHMQRLYESALALQIPISMPIEIFEAEVKEAVRRNEAHDGYIRLIITRGTGPLGLDPYKCCDSQTIIIVDAIAIYPKEYYDNGLELVTASTIRNHPAALSPRIKSLNYLNNILAKIEGLRAGCIETLMLNHKGEVAECTGDNLFIVKSQNLFTPPTDAGILAGITRSVVMQLAVSHGMPSHERTLTRHDIYVAEECFLTGTAAEVIGVTKLDGRLIGDGQVGPITRKLMKLFAEEARR